MSKKYQPLLITHYMSTWVTITEAVEITTKTIKQKITPSDIYRHALSGNILLSVYFQSPVILKKIQTFNGKIKFSSCQGIRISTPLSVNMKSARESKFSPLGFALP